MTRFPLPLLPALTALLAVLTSEVTSEAVLPPVISEFADVEDNFVKLSADSPFSLSCSAKGEPKPEVKWFRNEVEVITESGLAVSDEVISKLA